MAVLKYGSLAILFVLISSCSSVIDCLRKIKPYLEEKTLGDGFITQSYSDFIVVRVENANDDDYTIENVIIDGDLPTGINSSYNDRTVTFSGTPSVVGRYVFNVKIIIKSVSDTNDDDDLCGNSVSKSYEITVY